MPRVRLTVRRLMVAIALVGIAFGVVLERQGRFQRACDSHAPGMWTHVRNNKYYDHNGYEILDLDLYRTELKFHIFMYHKYDRATRFPWLPVGPDPPTPPRSPRGDRDPGLSPRPPVDE
jgi:hypothetical protein